MFKVLFSFQNWKVFATNLTLIDAASYLLNSSLLFFSDRFRDFLFVSSFSSPSSYKTYIYIYFFYKTYICKRTSKLRMRKRKTKLLKEKMSFSSLIFFLEVLSFNDGEKEVQNCQKNQPNSFHHHDDIKDHLHPLYNK